MNKKQIEILFDIYEKIESDKQKVNEALDILNPENENSFYYGFDLFNNFLEIIKIEDEVLHSWLEFFCDEVGLGKNKLSGNKYINGKIELGKPGDYYILINDKKFILKNKEDCINFLIENNYITK